LVISIESFIAKKLSSGRINYFWHKNLKNGNAKKLFFAIYDPKMNLFMTQWYIIKSVELKDISNAYLYFFVA
jgi:hypothetical protein